MAAVTWTSVGVGFGKDGLFVIPFTMPWAYVIRADTFVGSLSKASERCVILMLVVMALHLVVRGFVKRKEEFALRVCDFVTLVSDFVVRVTKPCCEVDERRPRVDGSGSKPGE
jgi:hypothetical protein